MSRKRGKQLMNQDAKKFAKQTIINMGPAVFTALLATALGFLALNTSPVPMVQDFGKMLTIGIVISFFIGLFILIPLLFIRDTFNFKRVKSRKQSEKSSSLENMIKKITTFVLKLKWIIIPLAIAIAVVGIYIDLDAGVETNVENFIPQDMQELAEVQELREILGTTEEVALLYEGENLYGQQVLNWSEDMTESLQAEFTNEVVKINSLNTLLKQINEGELPTASDVPHLLDGLPIEQRKMVINEEETAGVIKLGIAHMETYELETFIEQLHETLNESSVPEGLDVTVTGKTVVDVEMISALSTGRYKMTLLGMGLVFLGLLIMYRHPVKAFIPLLPISFIIGWSGLIMHFLGLDYTPLTATLGALIIGIGTEFTILLMERFYEERKQGVDRLGAVYIANEKIGKAIIVSSLTTAGGFSALLISDFVILSHFGLMTFINILLALCSIIFVMPAVLLILDRFVKTKVDKHQISAG
ncbi:efflux RND transporter permease subunit [Bacillus shivajii]|uniref:efflux RND transporter permease subunit n=1 Tax=Bacillus shivajii TaxID=1983719 RepID=UPI0021F548A2|nr:MMPL family transporter [Bacillus shivajii]